LPWCHGTRVNPDGPGWRAVCDGSGAELAGTNIAMTPSKSDSRHWAGRTSATWGCFGRPHPDTTSSVVWASVGCIFGSGRDAVAVAVQRILIETSSPSTICSQGGIHGALRHLSSHTPPGFPGPWDSTVEGGAEVFVAVIDRRHHQYPFIFTTPLSHLGQKVVH